MPHDRPLRRGWTTGACATAAAKSAYAALLTADFLDPVEITLPRGERPSFALAIARRDGTSASAGTGACGFPLPALPRRRGRGRRHRAWGQERESVP